jgi:hypothetical protein
MIGINGNEYYPDVSEHAVLYQLKTLLQHIRKGIVEDKYSWNYIVGINS